MKQVAKIYGYGIWNTLAFFDCGNCFPFRGAGGFWHFWVHLKMHKVINWKRVPIGCWRNNTRCEFQEAGTVPNHILNKAVARFYCHGDPLRWSWRWPGSWFISPVRATQWHTCRGHVCGPSTPPPKHELQANGLHTRRRKQHCIPSGHPMKGELLMDKNIR
jgi:hypothetical protein